MTTPTRTDAPGDETPFLTIPGGSLMPLPSVTPLAHNDEKPSRWTSPLEELLDLKPTPLPSTDAKEAPPMQGEESK